MTAEFTPTVVPLRHLYTVADAMRLLSIGRTALYEQIRSGRLRTVTQGKSRRIPAAALNDYVQLLIKEAEECHDQAA
ncbi:helix-turn-helix domain-containing protein [Actinokineospora auranticolor]|uniref:Excisionase family DNA binding protein n=1 Tax=Actinokineospora auranticolor TaxID=155976 RepID=A0A2S6GL04_9PSEU|nr:helix-turn-helix domain-containing protein [Actinokineospora auranticolor]PPK65831.1 excisionase family DNA binding protein [Actinokineospora auranticolor]